MVMGPLYAPIFNDSYYLGQGTGNVWNNPTHYAIKAVGLICFVWIVKLTDGEVRHKKWEYVLLSSLLILSALAKPSFLQAIIPGLGMYFILEMICKGIRKSIRSIACIVVAFIPSVLLLGCQFVLNFFAKTSIHDADGIGIGYGMFWSVVSDNFFVSFLLTMAFPLFVILIDAKRLLRDQAVQIAVCYGICAWLEAAFIYEKGERMLHGNWTWGWHLYAFIAWTLSIIKYFDMLRDRDMTMKKRVVSLCGGMPILFFHVLFGIGYYVSIIGTH